MSKTYKNIPSLHHFIEAAPITAIQNLLGQSPSVANDPSFVSINWLEAADTDSTSIRPTVLAYCVGIDSETAIFLNGHAYRINNLSEDRGPRALDVALNNLHLHDDDDQSIAIEYAGQQDHFGRATVIYLRAPELFDEAEKYFYAEHQRNYGKLYEGFELDLDNTEEFEWTDAKQTALETQLHERLDMDGPCLVQHLPFQQTQKNGDSTTVHLFLIRHAGATQSVQRMDADLSVIPYYYRPPVEATLLFHPDRKFVEVFSTQEPKRSLIASCFAETGLNADVSGRPVSLRQYNLRRFYQTLNLPQDVAADLDLIDIRVIEAEARPNNIKRRVSLKVDKNDDIEEAALETLGASNVFKNASLISRIVINVRYLKGTKEINLPITLSTPNRCNLGSRRDPYERQIGFDILEQYGVMKRVVPLTAPEEANLFSALLNLYEADASEVRRSTLEAWGTDIEMLRAGGFLKPMGRAMTVLRLDDHGEATDVSVRTQGGALVAFDPVTHDRFEVDPHELERYSVMKGWVSERVVKGLRGALQVGKRPKVDALVTKMGTLDVGGEEVAVYLARRLNRMDVVGQAQAHLRGENQTGYGLVLTATENHSEYLGRNVVVWLGDVLVASEGEITVDKERLLRALADGKHRAHSAVTIRFIVTSSRDGEERATLFIPGKDPWPLIGKQVRIVRRLYEAYQANNPILAGGALFANTGSNHPNNAFKGSNWEGYIGHPPGKKQGWMLLI